MIPQVPLEDSVVLFSILIPTEFLHIFLIIKYVLISISYSVKLLHSSFNIILNSD